MTVHASHTRRRFSKRRHVRARELIHHFPIADPTRRAPTIFRPTNFRKANTGRVASMIFPDISALRTCAGVSSSCKTDAETAGRNRRSAAVACAVLSAWDVSASRLRFSAGGQRTLQQPTKTAACEMHRGDAFLPEPVCRSDRRPEERSNGRVFLKVDADCAMSFQIIRIVPRQV